MGSDDDARRCLWFTAALLSQLTRVLSE